MALLNLSNNSNWTVFYDKHTLGFMKTQYEAIFINENTSTSLEILKETLKINDNYYCSYSRDNLYDVLNYFYEKENTYYGPCTLTDFLTSKKYLFICDKKIEDLKSEYTYLSNINNKIAL